MLKWGIYSIGLRYINSGDVLSKVEGCAPRSEYSRVGIL